MILLPDYLKNVSIKITFIKNTLNKNIHECTQLVLKSLSNRSLR